jgi:hypothetical protein
MDEIKEMAIKKMNFLESLSGPEQTCIAIWQALGKMDSYALRKLSTKDSQFNVLMAGFLINEDIKARHHDQPKYVYADDSNGEIIQDAPFKNHTDEELQLIETIVGRTTPYSSVKEAYPRPRKGY